nr:C-type lectin domain family 4 member M-like [Solea senegalensis]
MADKEKSTDFGGSFHKLISEEDTDEHALHLNQEKQQVSMSMVTTGSGLNHYKVLAVSLAVLSVILLATDIGLAVYYSRLAGQRTIADISSELAKLQAQYDTVIQNRDEVRKQLEREIREQLDTKWQLVHQMRRSKDYEKQCDKIQTEIVALKSSLLMMEEGCRHCLPGWFYIDSACYFISASDSLSSRTWSGARQFCKRYGGDLAVIDNSEKNRALVDLTKPHHIITANINDNGFWIGLSDEDVEGDWKWVNGQRLTEGFWNNGEPNNWRDLEDCVTVYNNKNPFLSWNDMPCSSHLRWICEKEPRSAS